MRTLFDIIQDVQNGGQPKYDELRYAVCALDALNTFHSLALHDLAKIEKRQDVVKPMHTAEFHFHNCFIRTKEAFGLSPKKWLGWQNDPANQVYLDRRKAINSSLVSVLSSGQSFERR